MTIVYEVNVKVVHQIVGEFSSWLQGHVQEMLAHDGFTSAQIFEEISQEPVKTDFQLVMIQYRIETLSALEHYFKHHAAAMRDKGIALFGDKISVTRRVFKSY